jgi:hypothetical protein
LPYVGDPPSFEKSTLSSAFSFDADSILIVNGRTVSRLSNGIVVLVDDNWLCSSFYSVPCDLKVSSDVVVEGGVFINENLFVENRRQVQGGIGVTDKVIVGDSVTFGVCY